jgi:hypothetical protein
MNQSRVGTLDCSLYLCVVRFCGLEMKSKLICLISQSMMMSSCKEVFLR